MKTRIILPGFIKPVFQSIAIAAFLGALIVAQGCEEDEGEAEECSGHGHMHDGECHCDNGYTNGPANPAVCLPTPEQSFECVAARDGWEQCLDNKVQYCHILEGMDPHFHWGADCAALGYECVELTNNTAVCVDDSSTCTAGAFKCENNTAYNCVTEEGHSHWAIEPCGTAAHCHEEAAEAHCEEMSAEFHAAAPNGMCATEIPEHYQMDLVMDGDMPPVAYIVRFSDQLAAATTVTFMIVDK